MLPNLNHLSLHDVANTMGFYEPTEEEQAAMNDDPVTLEKPLHTMTFRVRLPDDGPNGEPRYKFFSPAELWRWVKDHDTLPSREGPIWYEDWWALCNTYNPDHHNVPAWAHRLKRRSEYVAERAREQAAQAQQAARADAREAREGEPPAGVPAVAPVATTRLPRLRAGEVRMGAQRATDELQQWHFWLKPTDDADGADGASPRLNNEDMNAYVRQTLMGYMQNHFNSSEEVLRINRRFEIRAYPFYAQYTEAPNQMWMDAPVLLVICKLWLPRLAADRFMNFFYGEKLKYNGTCSMMRRWLGIIGADVGSPGGQTVLNWYSSWSYMQDNPEARAPGSEGYGPFRMPRDTYRNWRAYSFERDPLRIIPGRKGPQSATDVPIEWRLWVKGSFPEDPTISANHVRNYLARWFFNQQLVDPQSDLDIRQRLSLTVSHGSASGDAVRDMVSPVSRVDVQLYLPSETLARAFISACEDIGLSANFGSQPEDGFPAIMSSLVGITGARLIHEADFFFIRPGPLRQSRRMGACPYELVNKPSMGRREYEEWPHHTFLDLPPVNRVVEPGQSEPGPSEPGSSSSAAFQEQARQERLGEAQAQRAQQTDLSGSDSSSNDEEPAFGDDQGTAGDAGPSDEGAYEPTSPGYSPTSPSYSATIDPMTPDTESGERWIAQRASRAFDPNDPEYAVTIRWRFWLKGTMAGRQVLDISQLMANNFDGYMADNADFGAGNNGVPWFHRLCVEIFERRPLLRCEVSLKVSNATAHHFIPWVLSDRARHRSSWAKQAGAWHGYGPARARGEDYPRVDVGNMTQYPSPPEMRQDDFTQWLTWSFLREEGEEE